MNFLLPYPSYIFDVYLNFSLITFIGVFFLFYISYAITRFPNIKAKKHLAITLSQGVLLSCYLTLVIGATLLNRHYTVSNNINLDFLWSYKMVWHQHSKYLLREIIYNILMTIPLGILLPFIYSKCKHFIVTIFFSLLLSFSIEGLQYFFKIGLFEFDDVFNNTIGTSIGFLIYLTICDFKLLLVKIYNFFCKPKKLV